MSGPTKAVQKEDPPRETSRHPGSADFDRRLKAAVGSLAAWPARKRGIAEELAAHYAGALAEELGRCGDEQAAAEAAERRLGDLKKLTAELVCSVPWWERAICGLLGTKENAMSRWLWLAGVLAILFGMAMVMPAMAKHRQLGYWDEIWPMATGTTIVLAGVGVVVWRIGKRVLRAV